MSLSSRGSDNRRQAPGWGCSEECCTGVHLDGFAREKARYVSKAEGYSQTGSSFVGADLGSIIVVSVLSMPQMSRVTPFGDAAPPFVSTICSHETGVDEDMMSSYEGFLFNGASNTKIGT